MSSGAFCLPGANTCNYEIKKRMTTSGEKTSYQVRSFFVPSAVSVGFEDDN